MIKRIFKFIIAVVLLFVISYFSNNYFLNSEKISFSLLQVYLFHFISSVIIYVVVELVVNKIPNQAGYAYLVSIFLKIGFFVLLFQSSVFENQHLTKSEKLSLVIPLFLFLIAEAIAVSKLLNSK